MVLVYLPTFALEITSHVGKSTSTMVRIWVWFSYAFPMVFTWVRTSAGAETAGCCTSQGERSLVTTCSEQAEETAKKTCMKWMGR